MIKLTLMVSGIMNSYIIRLGIILAAINPLVSFAHQNEITSWEQACSAVESIVEEGDLIFLDIPNTVFRHVAESTLTWTSHVGIAFKDENGQWIVSESTIPVAKSGSLWTFLKRSSKF